MRAPREAIPGKVKALVTFDEWREGSVLPGELEVEIISAPGKAKK